MPLVAAALAGLVSMLGLGAIAIWRRRRGGAGPVLTAGTPPAGPAPERAAAIEAELQEMLAEERAAQLADERAPAVGR